MITAGQFWGGFIVCVIALFIFSLYNNYLYSAFLDGMKHKKEYREVWGKVKWIIENCKVEAYTETCGHTSYHMKNGVGIFLDSLRHKLIIKDVGFFDEPKDLNVELPWQYMIRARLAFFKHDIKEAKELRRGKKEFEIRSRKNAHDSNIKYLERAINKTKGDKK